MTQNTPPSFLSRIAIAIGSFFAILGNGRLAADVTRVRAGEAFAADVAQKLVGHGYVNRHMDPSMGAEDFSFMLQSKPGAYLRLGQGGEGSSFLHNARYDFNDDVLPLGAALHASLIEHGMPLRASS